MNEEFAVVVVNGKVRIARFLSAGHEAHPHIDFMRESDFRTLTANRFPGKEQVAERWLKHRGRHEYPNGVGFWPDGRVPPGCLNLWTGFGVKPIPGDISPFLDFVKSVICGGDEALFDYLWAWMADAVQNPACRPGIAVVLQGRQGVGKGFFAETFGRLFGRHFIQVAQERQLTGNFNSHLIDKLLVFADEGSFTSHRAGAVLKNLITSETIAAEPKGVDVIQVKNNVRLIIASNDEHVIGAGADERRYLVLSVSDIHQQDHTYFMQLAAWRDDGGLGALLHALQTHDLGRINLRMVPRTSGLFTQKVDSLDSVGRFYFECLKEGELIPSQPWSGFHSMRDLFDAWNAGHQGSSRRADETHFGKVFSALLPSPPEKCRPLINGKRVWGYKIPNLTDCRKAFEDKLGHKIDWPEAP